jgi:hypothetical protein
MGQYASLLSKRVADDYAVFRNTLCGRKLAPPKIRPIHNDQLLRAVERLQCSTNQKIHPIS